jgi:hypothetical protein
MNALMAIACGTFKTPTDAIAKALAFQRMKVFFR